MITAAQCRAARAWLNLTQAELAQLIDREGAAVRRFENGEYYPDSRISVRAHNVIALALQHVLEERGITFIPAVSDLRGGITGPE
jgi:DNA-binding XRE family transcriptional regulator